MLLEYRGEDALKRAAMAGDNYDKIVGTLNYFETRKANQSLDNITSQLQRQEQQRCSKGRRDHHSPRPSERPYLACVREEQGVCCRTQAAC